MSFVCPGCCGGDETRLLRLLRNGYNSGISDGKLMKPQPLDRPHVNAVVPVDGLSSVIGAGEAHPSGAELFEIADSQRHNSLVCGSNLIKPRSLDSLHVIAL
jgi:hypothetical protein